MKSILPYLLLALLGAARAAEPAKPVEIKLATILPGGASGHHGLMALRDAWQKSSAQSVKLTIYPGSADGGWVRYFSKSAAVRPVDFKPLKMFVWSGDPLQVTILRSLGYLPVSLETEQILTSLSTGMITALPVPPFLANALQYNRYAGHMVDLNWAPIIAALIVRRDTWQKIPAGLHADLLKAAEASGASLRRREREEDEESIAAMKKRGLVVHSVTPEIAAEWQALAEKVYPRIRGTNVPAELFDLVQAELAQYRATRGKTP